MTIRKGIREAVEAFKDVLPRIPDRWIRSIKKATWRDRAASDEAEANFKEVMSKVLDEERRKEGVLKRDDGFWRSRSETKGKPVIRDRIEKAMPEYEREFGPMLDAVNTFAETLPRKVIDFKENINKRLVPIVEKWKEVSGKA